MKKIFQVLFIFSIIIFVISCSDSGTDPVVNKDEPIPAQLKETVDATNDIGLQIFKEQIKENKDENVLISPVNVNLALSTMLNSTNGITKNEIKSKFKFTFQSDDELNLRIKNLIDAIKNSSTYVNFELANAILTKDNLNVESNFKLKIENNFGFKVFLKTLFDVSTSDEINLWFKTKTKGIFDQLIAFLDPNSNFNIYNSSVFSGDWKFKFTTDPIVKTFYNENKLNGALFYMNIKDSTIISTVNDLYTAFDLTYANNKYAMTVILPNENSNLKELISNFSVSSYFQMLSSMTAKHSDITIPKFNLKGDLDIKLHLKKLGINKAFDSEGDFSLITKLKGFFISSINHKTYLKIDDKGLKLSSDLTADIDFSDFKTALKLTVNKPFIVVIRDVKTKTILYYGKVSKLYV